MEQKPVIAIEINGKKYIEAGFYNVCQWWCNTYPEDVFVNEPREVVEIRTLMKVLLAKRTL